MVINELPPWKPFRADWTMSPGETLREVHQELGITGAELARRCNVSQKHMTSVITGKVGIGPRFAIALEQETGVSAEFWMMRTALWQLDKHRQDASRTTATPHAHS